MGPRTLAPRDEHKARIARALLKLSSARREKLDDVDFEVYVDGLRAFDAELVERICDELAVTAPEDFQPRFPPLYVLRERARKARELAYETRQLTAASLAERFPPLPPEVHEACLQKFRDVLARKVMK